MYHSGGNQCDNILNRFSYIVILTSTCVNKKRSSLKPTQDSRLKNVLGIFVCHIMLKAYDIFNIRFVFCIFVRESKNGKDFRSLDFLLFFTYGKVGSSPVLRLSLFPFFMSFVVVVLVCVCVCVWYGSIENNKSLAQYNLRILSFLIGRFLSHFRNSEWETLVSFGIYAILQIQYVPVCKACRWVLPSVFFSILE